MKIHGVKPRARNAAQVWCTSIQPRRAAQATAIGAVIARSPATKPMAIADRTNKEVLMTRSCVRGAAGQSSA